MSIEALGQTEEMRHVPRPELLIEKLNRDVRPRIETLYASCFESSRIQDSESLNQLEGRFRQVCRWLERLGELVRGKRSHTTHDFNLNSRLRSALTFAQESLAAADATQFRRRNPFHQFERSRGECAYAAFLVVVWELEQIAEIAARLDPDLSMKLIEPPYTLEPMPAVEQPLATIA